MKQQLKTLLKNPLISRFQNFIHPERIELFIIGNNG